MRFAGIEHGGVLGLSKGTSRVKILTARAGFLIAVLALTTIVCAALALSSIGTKEQPPVKARAAADTSTITAVITPLPDEVSNGTWSTLDASMSNDTAGTITNYTWDIFYKGTQTTRLAKTDTFKFRDLGLYKIILTVTDDHGNTSQAFTAVYSILDSDEDSLPDWWEMKYFMNLTQTATGDFDHDGYNNLEEFAAGQDPTAKNSRPGLVEELADNWMYLVAIAAAVVVALIILLPRMKRKQNAVVKRKIEAAIEIERALETDK
jgi:energy-converting hydrogenase Eha subunit A